MFQDLQLLFLQKACKFHRVDFHLVHQPLDLSNRCELGRLRPYRCNQGEESRQFPGEVGQLLLCALDCHRLGRTRTTGDRGHMVLPRLYSHSEPLRPVGSAVCETASTRGSCLGAAWHRHWLLWRRRLYGHFAPPLGRTYLQERGPRWRRSSGALLEGSKWCTCASDAARTNVRSRERWSQGEGCIAIVRPPRPPKTIVQGTHSTSRNCIIIIIIIIIIIFYRDRRIDGSARSSDKALSSIPGQLTQQAKQLTHNHGCCGVLHNQSKKVTCLGPLSGVWARLASRLWAWRARHDVAVLGRVSGVFRVWWAPERGGQL
jgi:hypothetical protein